MISFDPATVDIDAMLKRLHLANSRRCWARLTEQASSEQWSHRDFLAVLLAEEIGRLRESLAQYLQPHVLVVDEVGYLTYGSDAANVLFHVVNDRHLKKRPVVFTTNKSPLTAWGAVLHDPDLAEAIVDRTLDRGRLLILDGPSYRTRHLPLEVSDSNDDHASEPARISGKKRPEFPGPAWLYPRLEERGHA